MSRRSLIAPAPWVVPTTVVLVVCEITLNASAQSGGEFDLSWSTIDGGGTVFSTGGEFELSGTIGQPDAVVMSGGDFTLAGGFWVGAVICQPADFDCDGDVDLHDFVVFQLCFAGPNKAPAAGCTAHADLDGDQDVDIADFHVFVLNFTGPRQR